MLTPSLHSTTADPQTRYRCSGRSCWGFAMSGESDLLRQQLEELRLETGAKQESQRAEMESERAARKAAEAVVLRIQLGDKRAEMESLRAARGAADTMVRQHQLVRTWLDIERRLEEAKVGLRVELWEVGIRLEHEAFWAKVNGLPPAGQEDLFLRVDAEHVLQRQQQQQRELCQKIRLYGNL